MGGLRAVLVALLVLMPMIAAAQPTPDRGIIGETANQAYTTVAPPAENETGQDVTSEEIDLQVLLDIRDAEFDLVGVLFGGGKAETNARATILFSFRAVSVDRLEPALEQATGDANLTLQTFGFDSNRTVITAEEVRTAGGGVLLDAFQSYQEDAAKDRLQEAVPGITVLSTSFDWRNTAPAQRTREDQAPPDLRDPPLILEATMDLRFLDRFSLVDLASAMQGEGNETEKSPEELLRQRIEENQTLPFSQRSAFQVLGFGQLLSLDIPPGWRLNLTVQVPKGFTIAQTTEVFETSQDRRTASYYADGSQRVNATSTSGVVKLSDRSLVTGVLVSATLLLGFLVRIPVELGAAWYSRRRS